MSTVACYPGPDLLDECATRFEELSQGPARDTVDGSTRAFVFGMAMAGMALSLDWENADAPNAMQKARPSPFLY